MFNCHVFEVLNKEGKALLVKHTFLTKMYTTTILFYICSKAKSLANLASHAMNDYMCKGQRSMILAQNRCRKYPRFFN